MKRYQECGFWERCGRWWWCMPRAYAVCVCYTVLWAVQGCKRMHIADDKGVEPCTLADSVDTIWAVVMARYQVRMGKYQTLDEIRAALYAGSNKDAQGDREANSVQRLDGPGDSRWSQTGDSPRHQE